MPQRVITIRPDAKDWLVILPGHHLTRFRSRLDAEAFAMRVADDQSVIDVLNSDGLVEACLRKTGSFRLDRG
jgi:hypothetical protein